MTVVIMGISYVFIEIMNVESTSARFRNTCVTALNMSCNYFGQETYKRSDFGTVDVEDIKGIQVKLLLVVDFTMVQMLIQYTMICMVVAMNLKGGLVDLEVITQI